MKYNTIYRLTFDAEINHSSEDRVLALEQLGDGEEAFCRLGCSKGLTLVKTKNKSYFLYKEIKINSVYKT